MQLWEEKVMERLEGRSEGRNEGRSEGRSEGEERVSRLNLLLIGQKRYEDLEKASRDRAYRGSCLKHLESKSAVALVLPRAAALSAAEKCLQL